MWCWRRKAVAAAYKEAWQRAETFRALLKSTAQPVGGTQKPAPGTGLPDCDALRKAPLPAAATLKKEDRLAEKQWG